MRILNDSDILFVYFSDHEAKKQTLIFKGKAGEFRKLVGEDWDGFGKGDSFEIDFEDEGVKKVRVFKVDGSLSVKDTAIEEKYFVGPDDLNPNKIEYQNLNFEDYLE